MKLNPAVAAEAEKLAQLRTMGSMGLSIPMSVFGPRPVLDGMIAEQANGDEQKRALLEAEGTEHVMGEQLANSLINAGGATYRSLNAPNFGGLPSLI
jgi:hypothetical protein